MADKAKSGMETRKYVIAVRRDKRSEAPIDWQQRLAAIEGVSLEGATGNRAQFTANAETLRKVKSLFSDCCHIEEAVERGSL